MQDGHDVIYQMPLVHEAFAASRTSDSKGSRRGYCSYEPVVRAMNANRRKTRTRLSLWLLPTPSGLDGPGQLSFASVVSAPVSAITARRGVPTLLASP